MANAIIESAKERMDKAGDALRRELGNIRAVLLIHQFYVILQQNTMGQTHHLIN